MRLAYVVDGRMPTEKANGYQSAQMCQAFAENGCDVRLVFPAKRATGPKARGDVPLEAYYNLRRRIESTRLRTLDNNHLLENVLRVGNDGLLGQAMSVASSYATAFSLTMHLIRKDYDAVFVRSANLLAGMELMTPRKILARTFFEIHTLPGRKSSLGRLARAMGRTAGIISVTGALSDAVGRMGIHAGKLLVSHDGVDLESFEVAVSRSEARSHLGLPPDRIIAAYVGKFHTMGKEKGIPDIIRSARHLIDDLPSLTFLFVGGPVDRLGEYERIIAEEGLPRERFVFLDKRPIAEVPLFLAASDVLLMPFPWSEHYAYYMSPLKLFEYMSAGRPIVATSLPSVMEVLADGVNALLAQPGDSSSIAGAIRRAIEEPALSARLAAAAREDVRKYTWRRRAASILDFMSSRLAEGGVRTPATAGRIRGAIESARAGRQASAMSK